MSLFAPCCVSSADRKITLFFCSLAIPSAEDTKLYYLQSRYYNPEWGRFLNADVYAATGQGLLGSNMYAYCNNNPVNAYDPCGTCIHYWFLLGLVDCDDCKKSKSFIDDFKNSDGSYSLYDNKRNDPDKRFHEQAFVTSASGASFDLLEGEATLGSIDATLITGGWETENLDISLFDIGKAEASAGLSKGQFSLSAMASVWSPSVGFNIFGVNISLTAHAGSAGAKIEAGSRGFSIGAAAVFGVGLSVSWD